MVEEKTWCMWLLSEDDIKGIAERSGLSLEGKDLDDIASQVKKGISWALDDVWEDAVEEAIKNTPTEEEEEVYEF